MGSEKKILRAAHGATLTEISLRSNGAIVEQRFHVATLRTPETWNFHTLLDAESRWQDEANLCENDPFVQRRLARR